MHMSQFDPPRDRPARIFEEMIMSEVNNVKAIRARNAE